VKNVENFEKIEIGENAKNVKTVGVGYVIVTVRKE
jgi:hypothetical protein